MSRTWALLVVLVATAVSGCVAPGTVGDAAPRAGDDDAPFGEPPSQDTARSADRSGGEGNRSDGQAPDNETPLTDLRVTDVGSRHFNVSYRVTEGGRHRVGVAGPDDPWNWSANRTGTGFHHVTVDDRLPNTTYRYTVALHDDSQVANTSGQIRTDPVPYGWADPEETSVRPGTLLKGEGWACTVGFIMTGSRNATVYALTAGHCLQEVEDGETLYVAQPDWALYGEQTGMGPDRNLTPLGVVEHYEKREFRDWGLIRVRADVRPMVSPRLVHWTGPTGVAAPAALAPGDRLCQFGQMGVSDATPQVRPRCGRYVAEPAAPLHNGTYYMAMPVAADGDSGSPVVDYATGQAVGLLNQGFGANLVAGPRLSAILDWAGEAGYDLRLAGAAYDPPPGRPIG